MDSKLKNNAHLIIPLILILALALRIYNINLQSLWRDEAFSVNLAMKSLQDVFTVAAKDTQAPLHLVLLHIWGRIFSFSEISVRMLSTLCDFVSLIMIYKIVRVTSKNFVLATIALSLATVSPLLIFYSQEARPYALLTALFLSTFYFFVRIIHNSERTKDYVFFTIFNILGVYTHNIFLFPFITFAILYLFKILIFRKWYRLLKPLQIFAIIYLAIGAAYMPWFLNLVDQYSTLSSKGFWLVFDPFKSVAETFYFFAIGHTYNGNFLFLDHIFTLCIITSLFITLGIGVSRELKIIYTNPETTIFRAISTLVLFGVLVLVYLVSFKTPFFYVRYLVFIFPVILMISSKGYLELLKVHKLTGIILFVAFLFSNVGFLFYNIESNIFKEDYRAAVSYIDKTYDEKTDIVISPSALTFHGMQYYFKKPSYIYNPERNLAYYEGTAILALENYYDGDLARYENIYLVELASEDKLKKELELAGFEKIAEPEIEELKVSLWRKILT